MELGPFRVPPREATSKRPWRHFIIIIKYKNKAAKYSTQNTEWGRGAGWLSPHTCKDDEGVQGRNYCWANDSCHCEVSPLVP